MLRALRSTTRLTAVHRNHVSHRIVVPFVSRNASLSSSHPPSGKATLVSAPSADRLESEEIDPDSVRDALVLITDRAAEQLRTISMREKDPTVALRVSVESGGCHGYQYKLDLTSTNSAESADDFRFEHPDKQPSFIVVDPVSLGLLKGSTIDFATELIGSSFRIVENPQAAGGCGCGVSWEAKL